MVKFKITPSRFAEACNIYEYLAAGNADVKVITSIAPRFIVNADGEYLVEVVHDEEGYISEYKNNADAIKQMFQITPARLKKLAKEFSEAANQIVNPTSDGVSNGQ